MKINPYAIFKIMILFSTLAPFLLWLNILIVEWYQGYAVMLETRDVLMFEIPVVTAWTICLAIVIIKESVEETKKTKSQKHIAS